MSVLVRAPCLVVLSALVLMLTLWERVDALSLPWLALPVAIAIMAASHSESLKGQYRIAAFVLIVTILSAWRIVFALQQPLFFPERTRATGLVTEVRPWGKIFAATVDSPEGSYLLKIPFASLAEGDLIRVEGKVKPLRGTSPGSDFREDRFWRARGVIAQISSPQIQAIETESPPNDDKWTFGFHSRRFGLYRSMAVHLPPLTSAYMRAAWTGKRDADLNERHKRWGTSHILSVSGFHVGLVVAVASFFLKRGIARALLLSCILWGYIFLAGAPASAMRAGLMIQFVLLGEVAGRPVSALNSVALAAVLLLLWSPFWFWDVGWRLSVLATLTIGAVLERSAPGDRRVWAVMSPLIWLTTFPLVSRTFGPVPAAGIIVNLLALPFFGFVLPWTSLFALLHLSGIPGAAFLLKISEAAFKTWDFLADVATSLLPWYFEWNLFLAVGGILFFLMLVCRSLFVPWRNVALIALAGSVAYIFFA